MLVVAGPAMAIVISGSAPTALAYHRRVEPSASACVARSTIRADGRPRPCQSDSHGRQCCRPTRLLADCVLEGLADLDLRHRRCRDLHLLTRRGVATGARGA